ncbi:MAG: ankyrin repeat domain-containing protein [Geminicoccaceae bacterium]
MDPDEPAEKLKRALYFGRKQVVRDLLDEDPGIPQQDLGLQIATYDLEAVRTALADPSKAREPIGVRTPILHLAFSKYIHMAPDKRNEMLAIADLLLANGADPNDGFSPEPEADYRLSALYGALGHADNMPLAAWLLDHGANPDDGESLYHSTELGHHEGLKLLIRHGANPRGTNALLRALDFDDREAVRLLLDQGADPDETIPDHPDGLSFGVIPALHQAARRCCSADTADLLLERGADPLRRWNGHTAHALAKIYGNQAVAQLLASKGHAETLSPLEAALAACAEGRAPKQPIDPAALGDEDKRLITRIVQKPDRLDHVKALVEAGLDPNQADEQNLPPLHLAGWVGLPPHVAYLLTLSPDLAHKNNYGGDALGTVIHGAEFAPDRAERDHIGCARLLLEAGAELRPGHIEGTGSEDMAAFLRGWVDG